MTENKLTTAIIIVIVLVMLAGVGVLYVTNQKNEDVDKTEQVDENQTKDSDKTKNDDSELKSDDNKDDKGQFSGEVDKQQAGKIATDKYGGTIKNVEDDDHHGAPAWEVEIRDSKEGRIEVKVDKKTGEILGMEKD